MKVQEEGGCPTFRPTRAAFERPFCDFVKEVFRKHPDLPCFKVVPPAGWKPRRRSPDLDKIRINTPIKQHVFGKSGSYVCILEEQRGMSAADFKRLSERPEHQPPAKGSRGTPAPAADGGAPGGEVNERAFWSGVTNSPPLYGADTPVSLFDEKLAWGWNLQHLGCMLQDPEYDVPNIPGVTSPMTYFGMWKSFFGWHKEDIDLYSTNYLHFGAPKIWYCVAPKDNPKFDAMAEALYPDLYRACHGFMRHKDILISPKVLKAYNVPFVQCRQEAGEFIVLNAAAYHAGFNTGFNCAEAVNFAMEDWVEAGKAAVPCTCTALPEGVALDMGIFCPELREDSSDEEDSEEEESEEESEAEEEEEEQPARRRRAPATPPRKRAAAAARGRKPATSTESESESEAEGSSSDEEEAEAPARKRRRAAGGSVPRAAAASKPAQPAVVRPASSVPDVVKAPTRASDVPRGAAPAQWGKVAEERPLAVVDRDEHTRQLKFSLVHRLDRPSSKPGALWVGHLQEGPDGLFRPQGPAKLLQLGVQYPRVVHVRAEWLPAEGRKRAAGWSLKTKAQRILM
ncbi:Jumonji domain-containing [Micractinium conductrix]|uniref:Jumonji domain-containing n=1 Tax=Micractinium conductrix TaxID=554055 RepID=A0A2P6VHQ3_9CHLO|nr:Jumonji domain-containing [Micractinium conductrix]|eukprot:PSC73626.1 Jumonji domain-containing [Micractinium conductrix]